MMRINTPVIVCTIDKVSFVLMVLFKNQTVTITNSIPNK